MAIVTLGIDLAKNVFAHHRVDATGKPVLVRRSVPRAKLLELVASLPACLMGMEACSGAHHWARPPRSRCADLAFCAGLDAAPEGQVQQKR